MDCNMRPCNVEHCVREVSVQQIFPPGIELAPMVGISHTPLDTPNRPSQAVGVRCGNTEGWHPRKGFRMVTREQCSTFWHPSTLTELLRWRALEQPERLAYTFLTDGETEETRLTYGELDRQARAIGAHLQHLRAAGERVLLLYP